MAVRPDLELVRLRAQIDALRQDVERITDLFAQYMDEAHLERAERVSRAHDKARIAFTIIGGEEAESSQFRDCCAVGQRNNGIFGSGALIAPRIVLTAAHVGPKGGNPTQDTVSFPLQTSNRLDGGPVLSGVLSEHPGFVLGGGEIATRHDIAVMTLFQDAGEPPIPLAATAEMEEADGVILAGFGRTGPSPATSGVKRFVEAPIQFMKKPGAVVPEQFRGLIDPASEFVAGSEGHSACRIDSGGPAYIVTTAGLKLAGVISRGPGVSACPPVVFLTRVDFHAAWIQEQINAAGG